MSALEPGSPDLPERAEGSGYDPGSRPIETERSEPLEHDEESPLPGFAPDDLDDGRPLYYWKSRWGAGAKIQIGIESAYLLALVASTTWIILLLVSGGTLPGWLDGLQESPALAALVSGVLGGTLFDIKWHYHLVAKGFWHADRLLWRIFTPLVSGAVALTISLFVVSGVLMIIDREVMSSTTALVSVGVLVGYFSDNAIGSLATLAKRIFGPASSHRARNEQSSSD